MNLSTRHVEVQGAGSTYSLAVALGLCNVFNQTTASASVTPHTRASANVVSVGAEGCRRRSLPWRSRGMIMAVTRTRLSTTVDRNLLDHARQDSRGVERRSADRCGVGGTARTEPWVVWVRSSSRSEVNSPATTKIAQGWGLAARTPLVLSMSAVSCRWLAD